jgi:hypothetical protein
LEEGIAGHLGTISKCHSRNAIVELRITVHYTHMGRALDALEGDLAFAEINTDSITSI